MPDQLTQSTRIDLNPSAKPLRQRQAAHKPSARNGEKDRADIENIKQLLQDMRSYLKR